MKERDMNQMELGLESGRRCQSINRRRWRTSRAGWWFERMRQVVEGASDFEAAPERPSQATWFHETGKGEEAAVPGGAELAE